jgi:hypothetical protein
VLYKIKDYYLPRKRYCKAWLGTGNKIEQGFLNMARMKKLIAALLLAGVVSCNNESPQQKLTTVDSNVAGNPDSLPQTLYLDSHRVDTSFPVAMDSAGPTVRPKDTSYSDDR